MLWTICPAVIFAASRNDKVIGRTKILVVLIITRNGFNHSGAPSGRKCATDFFGTILPKMSLNLGLYDVPSPRYLP